MDAKEQIFEFRGYQEFYADWLQIPIEKFDQTNYQQNANIKQC
tara:strand:+ start:81 stop:209 length:129 start_codon:yes stop_codon:yes gene_type:complete